MPRLAPQIAGKLAAPALACAALAAASACAAAGPYNPENLPADQIGQVGEICHSVMGLEPGMRAFATCTESLSRSAAKLDRNTDLQQARQDCVAKGLRPGEPALAQCVVDATSDTAAPHRAGAAPVRAPGARVRSYFSVSWQEAHQRQRMACAALGYDPSGVGFYNCVANLQASMFRTEHPST